MLSLQKVRRLEVSNLLRKVRKMQYISDRLKTNHSSLKGTKTVKESQNDTDEFQPLSHQNNLPVSLQYFSNNTLEKSAGSENDTESFAMIKESLEKIKFDIENLKAQKIKHQDLLKESNDPELNATALLIGTGDPDHPPSTVPCGGCGAILHCNDPAIPGFVPQEKFKGQREVDLVHLRCKRCTLLDTSSKIIQTDIDKETYQEIIKKIKKEMALVLMIVDVTDMANSIIPEFLSDIGKKRPIFIIGNKIDLIPKDSAGHLNGILHRLQLECERAELNPSGRNIKYTCLVSAKTGYGIESLISKLIKDWEVRGNIYLVGTTNSGKSTLFNRFLESDYCKHTCRDIVQRATVSRWPGTTLNVIKFPIIRASKWKMFLRTMRLKEQVLAESERIQKRKERLKEHGRSRNAILIGHVGKTDFRNEDVKAEENKKYETRGHQFASYSFDTNSGFVELKASFNKSTVLDRRRTILEDMYPDSKWACDTPGLINKNQLIHSLTGEELKVILKHEIIRPRVFVMKPGDVMFITGLARIDYLEGKPRTYVTVHTNHFLPVHVVWDCNADAFYKENIGTDILGVPLGDSERLGRLPSLCGREFFIETEDNSVASADLQLSSLGWVSFAAEDTTVHVRAYTPEGRGMHLRSPALLPNIKAFKGSRIVDTKQFDFKKLKT